jgi:hypothetical protein
MPDMGVCCIEIITWLGRESLVQTFDEYLKCNVVEIRTLLDESLDSDKDLNGIQNVYYF